MGKRRQTTKRKRIKKNKRKMRKKEPDLYCYKALFLLSLLPFSPTPHSGPPNVLIMEIHSEKNLPRHRMGVKAKKKKNERKKAEKVDVLSHVLKRRRKKRKGRQGEEERIWKRWKKKLWRPETIDSRLKSSLEDFPFEEERVEKKIKNSKSDI